MIHILGVEYSLLTERVIAKLPNYQYFCRHYRLRLDLKDIPNLKWEPNVTVDTDFTSAMFKLDSSTFTFWFSCYSSCVSCFFIIFDPRQNKVF